MINHNEFTTHSTHNTEKDERFWKTKEVDKHIFFMKKWSGFQGNKSKAVDKFRYHLNKLILSFGSLEVPASCDMDYIINILESMEKDNYTAHDVYDNHKDKVVKLAELIRSRVDYWRWNQEGQL